MNREEQFRLAYIIVGLLRMIVAILMATHGWHSVEQMDSCVSQSAMLKEQEQHLWEIGGLL